MPTISTRGHIVFDDSVPPEFVDLVRETLGQSEFIETEWYDMDERTNDVLLVREVHE